MNSIHSQVGFSATIWHWQMKRHIHTCCWQKTALLFIAAYTQPPFSQKYTVRKCALATIHSNSMHFVEQGPTKHIKSQRCVLLRLAGSMTTSLESIPSWSISNCVFHFPVTSAGRRLSSGWPCRNFCSHDSCVVLLRRLTLITIQQYRMCPFFFFKKKTNILYVLPDS